MSETDDQGILYTILDGSYCVGLNTEANDNAGKNLIVPNVILPSFINKIKLTRIGTYAFRTNTKIQSIFIPNSITVLGFDCFAFSSLATIQFDHFSSLSVLERGIFYHCHEIKVIQFPFSVNSLGFLALSHTSLKILTIPGKLTYVSDFLFGLNNPSVDFYRIPESLRLNSQYKINQFSDFNGTITYIRFSQEKSFKSYIHRNALLFTLMIGLN